MTITSRSGRRWAAIGLTALVGCGLLGCQAAGPRATGPLDVPRDNSAELVMHIADQPFVTAEAGYRAVYVLAHGEAFTGDFTELVAALRGEDLIGKNWDYPAELYLQRGTVGFMICRACEIRGGLNWALTGCGRYAWRELQYRGLFVGGGEGGLMTGGEFVGLLTRAEDYLRKTGKRGYSTVELGTPG